MANNEKEIVLELGQIIKIKSTSNIEFNDKNFYINYLDNNLVELIDEFDLSIKKLEIENNKFTDESIEDILILYTPDKKGYIKQKNLSINTWISIEFGGEVPKIVNGKISDLEEDMLELTTYPDNKIIYIDFAYKGIPKDIPIISINLFSEPVISTDTEEKKEEETQNIEDEEIDIEIDNLGEELEKEIEIPDISDKLKNTFIEADEIVFGEVLKEVEEEEDVKEEERRYGIETQTNDLLDAFLSSIPSDNISRKMENQIHLLIERFKQLREIYSNFDENGNAETPKIKTSNHKPLKEIFFDLKKNIKWLKPIIKNKKKIYDSFGKEDQIAKDVVPLTLALSREEEYEIYEQYRSNEIPDEENKYNYYYKAISKYFTPFDITHDKDDIIIEKNVNANIECIKNNLDNNESTQICLNKVSEMEFSMDKYTTGLTRLHVENLKGSRMKPERIQLTQSDRISINGIMLLPYSMKKYSKMFLPKTNILNKSHLNKLNILLNDVLKYNSTITHMESIPGSTNEIAKPFENSRHLFDKGTTSLLFKGKNKFQDRNQEQQFKIILDKIIPQTKELIRLTKIKNGVSYHEIMKELEMYYVYDDDITYSQYKEILTLVENEINNYKKEYFETNKKCINFIANSKTYNKKSEITNIFKGDYNQTTALQKAVQIEKTYNLLKNQDNNFMILETDEKIHPENDGEHELLYSNEEIINIMLNYDNMEYFNNLLIEEILELFQNENIEDIVKDELDKTINEIDENKDNEECKNLILAKRYIDIDELTEDDGDLNLRFDKKYDDQIKYEIMHEFEEDRNVLGAEELLSKLKNHLIKKVGVSEILAERDALAMIEGYKRVVDGDYAILDMSDDSETNIKYFVRENNKWRLDKKINNIDESLINFCNAKKNCINIKKECDSNEVAKNKIKKNIMTEILNNFENSLEESYDLLKKKYKKLELVTLNKLIKLKNLQLKHTNRYDRLFKKLSGDIDIEDIIVSPYEGLRDAILNQSDIVKKYSDILIFIDNYCYQENFDSKTETDNIDDEKMWWFYCNKTNVKILPTYFKPLAESFFGSKQMYEETINTICNDRGVLSDDGDKIVDKYSGYYIKNIEFDTSEGYDEKGFKNVTRSVMETNVSYKEPQFNYKSKTAKIIQKILNKIDKKINISLDDKYNLIIKHVVELIDNNLGKEKDYNLKIEKFKNKNKSKKIKIKSYTEAYDDLLMYSLIAMYIIAIQISIPSIHTIKNYDTCKKSFDGYPLNGDNYGIMEYVCCVFLKTRSNDRPWKSLFTINKSNYDKVMEKMKKKLKLFMDNKILVKEEIKNLIDKKNKWLLTNPDIEIIPEKFKLSNWIHFKPPLQKIKVKRATNISNEFEKLLINDIQKASYAQFERLWNLKGKIVNFSLMIQESIQSIINNQPLLLNTIDEIPFVENACCHDGANSVYKYFAEKENSIYKYNKILKDIEKIYNFYTNIQKPPIIFSQENTRIIFPKLSTDFNEENIYLTFIKHCKFNSGINIDEQISNLCIKKTSEIKKEMNIEEKIEILKKEGNVYSIESLYQLLNIIHRKNIVNIDIKDVVYSPRKKFEDCINFLLQKDITIFDKEMLISFKEIYDRFTVFDLDNEDEGINNLMEYIKSKNNDLMNNIIDFIKTNNNTRKINTFLKEIYTWKNKKSNYLLEEDEVGYTIYSAMHSFINFTCIYFPTTIIKSVNNKSKIPSHWNISSDKHRSDIKNIIENEFVNFNKFHNDPSLKKLLIEIKKNMKIFTLIIKTIPFFSKYKFNEKTIDTISNGEMISLFSVYMFLSSLNSYINIFDIYDFNLNQEFEDDDLMYGEKERLKKLISEILVNYFEYFIKYKKVMDFSNEDITKKVLKSKEKEKERKKDQLKNLTEESREIENLLKTHKLGEWGLGLTSAVFKYKSSQYDKERQELEDIAFEEFSKGVQDEVTEMNREIYKLDFSERNAIDTRINNEVYNINHLPEDDDFGDDDHIDYS